MDLAGQVEHVAVTNPARPGNKGDLKQLHIFLLVPDTGTFCPASAETQQRMHLGWV